MYAQTSQDLNFEIVTPEELLYSSKASQVVVPADKGQMGILPNHAPMIVTLNSGIIDVYQTDKIEERIFVGDGFAHITENSCTIMADEGIKVSDIKQDEVQAYIDKVHEELERTREEDERAMLEKSLAVARAKLDLLRMWTQQGGQG